MTGSELESSYQAFNKNKNESSPKAFNKYILNY